MQIFVSISVIIMWWKHFCCFKTCSTECRRQGKTSESHKGEKKTAFFLKTNSFISIKLSIERSDYFKLYCGRMNEQFCIYAHVAF